MKPKRGGSIIYSPYSSSAVGGGAVGGTKSSSSSSSAADHTNMAAKRQKDRATGEAPRAKQNTRPLFQNEQDDDGGDDESKSRTLTLTDSFTTAQESATTNGGGGGGGSSSYYTQDSVFRSDGSVASHGSSVMSESTLVESIDENLMNLESFYSKLFGGGRGSSSKRQEEGPSSVPNKPVTRTYSLKGDDTASSHSHASASLVTENTKSQSNADLDSVFGRSEASSSFKTSDDTTADDTTTMGDTKSQSNVDYDDSVFGRSEASSSFKTSDNTTADDTTYSGTADDTMYSEIYGNSVRGGPVLESFEERDDPSSSSTTLEQSEVYSGRHRASQGVVHNIWDTISEGSEETSDSAGEEGSEADDTVGATSILRMATNKPAPVSINKPAPVSSTETTEVPSAAPLGRGTQATPKSRGSTSSNESVRTPNHSILKKPDKHSTTTPAAKPERDLSKKVGSAAKIEVPRPPTTSILKMPTKAAAPGARQKPFTHRFSNLLGHRPKKTDPQEVPDPLSTTPPPEEEPTEAMLPTPGANSSPRVRFSVDLSKYLQKYDDTDDYDNSIGGGGGGSSCSGSGNDQELRQVCASSIPNFLSSWFQALASGDHINEACMSTTTRVDDGESDPHEEDPAEEEERDEMPSSNSAEDTVPPNRSSPTTNTSEARETISSSPHIADNKDHKKKEKGQKLDKKTVKKTNPKDSKKKEDKVTLRDLFSRKKETPTKAVNSSTKVKTSGSSIRGAAAASSSKVKIPAPLRKGRTTAVKATVVPPKKRKELPLVQAFEMHAVPSSGTPQRRGANAAAHLSKAEARAVTESKRSEARFHRRRLHALREDSSRSSSEYEAHVAIPPSLY